MLTVEMARDADRPTSALLIERPDIWFRALSLATRTTGMIYLPKLPGQDGVAHACGGYVPYKQPSREQIEKEQIEKEQERIRREIEQRERRIREISTEISEKQGQLEKLRREVEELRRKLGGASASAVYVPDGQVEWLLHEVGHWLAATPEERLLPNYGLEDEIVGIVDGREVIHVPQSGFLRDREMVAWAFEEIVLAPWAPARELTAPTCRDGVAFSFNGPMPTDALREAERHMRDERLVIEEWRAIYGQWIDHEKARRGGPSWKRAN